MLTPDVNRPDRTDTTAPGRARRRPSRAFTIVEAVIAVCILGVAMPAMLWAIKESVRTRANPVLAARARWLAAEKLEDVIADRHSTTRGYAYLLNANYAAETPVTGFAGMNRSVSITETGPNFAAGTGWKTVTVTVTYTDGTGVSRSLPLSTVLTDYTP
jgi:type II secretory pathway pseudopilin PulG